jgi:hypothetical protein
MLYLLAKFADINVAFLVLQALIAHEICGDMSCLLEVESGTWAMAGQYTVKKG